MFRYAILFNNNVKTEIHIKRPVIEEESIIEKIYISTSFLL